MANAEAKEGDRRDVTVTLTSAFEASQDPRTGEVRMTPGTGRVDATVTRGVNGDRLTLLALLLGFAITIGVAIDGNVLVRIVAGVATLFGLGGILHAVYRFDRSTHVVMVFVHWVSGRRL